MFTTIICYIVSASGGYTLIFTTSDTSWDIYIYKLYSAPLDRSIDRIGFKRETRVGNAFNRLKVESRKSNDATNRSLAWRSAAMFGARNSTHRRFVWKSYARVVSTKGKIISDCRDQRDLCAENRKDRPSSWIADNQGEKRKKSFGLFLVDRRVRLSIREGNLRPLPPPLRRNLFSSRLFTPDPRKYSREYSYLFRAMFENWCCSL